MHGCGPQTKCQEAMYSIYRAHVPRPSELWIDDPKREELARLGIQNLRLARNMSFVDKDQYYISDLIIRTYEALDTIVIVNRARNISRREI